MNIIPHVWHLKTQHHIYTTIANYFVSIFSVLFSLASFVLYLVLYFMDFKANVLKPDDITQFNWTSKDRADLNFSFYFVVVATGLFAANIAVILLLGVQCKSMKYCANMNEKTLDGVMMYWDCCSSKDNVL